MNARAVSIFPKCANCYFFIPHGTKICGIDFNPEKYDVCKKFGICASTIKLKCSFYGKYFLKK
jgi:hypothetical protein